MAAYLVPLSRALGPGPIAPSRVEPRALAPSPEPQAEAQGPGPGPSPGARGSQHNATTHSARAPRPRGPELRAQVLGPARSRAEPLARAAGTGPKLRPRASRDTLGRPLDEDP